MSSHILIIEDDAVLGNVLRDRLTNAGYEVTLIADGKEGFDAIISKKPDLVLVDILLPTMSGHEVMEAKVKDKSVRDIPVIVISNSGQSAELERSLDLGARDYFVKTHLDPEEVLEKVHAIIPTSPDASVRSIAGKKVFIVEDDKFLSDVLKKKLTNEGCTICHSITGEDTVALAKTEKPDIILLDLILPGTSGFDILQKLKGTPETKNIPVVILSNLSQKEDMDRAQALGVSKYMVKAMSTPENIFRTIKAMLS